jgi:hypothetical protein
MLYMSKFITNKLFERKRLLHAIVTTITCLLSSFLNTLIFSFFSLSFHASSHHSLFLILELLLVDSYFLFIFQRQHFWCMHTIFDGKVQQLHHSFLSHVITFYNNLPKKIKEKQCTILIHFFPLEDFFFIFPCSFWFDFNMFSIILILLFCITMKLFFHCSYFFFLSIH